MGEGQLTQQAVAFARTLQLGAVPKTTRSLASQLVADFVAVTLAASGSEVGDAITSYARQFSGPRFGVVLGDGARVPVATAALANGTLAHALDLDDDEPILMIGHPSSPVLAALFSLSHLEHRTGAELLAAFIVGVETEIAIGATVNPRHYTDGWHTTSTIGTLGATLACSRMRQLDETQTLHSLGIAASCASGIKRNFGTMTKPLHVGRAAEAAIVATDLAAAGFTADMSILDGPFGIPAMWGRQEDTNTTTFRFERLGRSFGLDNPGVAIKRYPSCSNTHPALDALLEMRNEGLLESGVRRIACHVAPGTETILQFDHPRTPLEAKFSMQYCLAAAAVRGRIWIGDFSVAAISDPKVRALMERVQLVMDPQLVRGEEGVSTAAHLSIVTCDGRAVERTAEFARGSRQSPLRDGELREKFLLCSEPMLGLRTGELFDRLLAIEEEPDIAGLVDSLSAEPRR